MFEHRSEPLVARKAYLLRLARSAGFGAVMIASSLLIGVVGYHRIVGLGWIDSVLNASMILGGMGPVDRMETDAGKLFASGYALFSGFALITSVGVVIAPMLHRFMHRFHLEMEGDEDETPRS